MFNLYPDGGQDPNSEFFNTLLDNNIQQPQQYDEEGSESPTEQQSAPDLLEDNEFINGLQNYAKEDGNNDLQSQIDELKQQLSLRDHERNLDQIQSDLEEQLMLAQFYQTPEGEDELMSKYDPKDPNDQGASGPKYSFKEGIAAGESGGRYDIANTSGQSSAYGKYQFTDAAQKDAYTQMGGAAKWGNFANFQQQFRSSPDVQEQAMSKRLEQATKIVGNDPIALALYHYAPKFGMLYHDGKLDLNKRPSDYGVGVGTSNPTFKKFLSTHGLKGKFSNGGYGATYMGGRLGVVQKVKKPKYQTC